MKETRKRTIYAKLNIIILTNKKHNVKIKKHCERNSVEIGL